MGETAGNILDILQKLWLLSYMLDLRIPAITVCFLYLKETLNERIICSNFLFSNMFLNLLRESSSVCYLLLYSTLNHCWEKGYRNLLRLFYIYLSRFFRILFFKVQVFQDPKLSGFKLSKLLLLLIQRPIPVSRFSVQVQILEAAVLIHS